MRLRVSASPGIFSLFLFLLLSRVCVYRRARAIQSCDASSTTMKTFFQHNNFAAFLNEDAETRLGCANRVPPLLLLSSSHRAPALRSTSRFSGGRLLSRTADFSPDYYTPRQRLPPRLRGTQGTSMRARACVMQNAFRKACK